MKKYKINFTFNPLMQCITGKFDGYMIVLDAYFNKDTYYYNRPFRQTQSNYNKLVKHIKNNKIMSNLTD